MTITSAGKRDLRMNKMQLADTIASEPLYGWRQKTNYFKVAMEWLMWCEHCLRQVEWNALSEEGRAEDDEMAVAYPGSIHRHHPLHGQRIQHVRNVGEHSVSWTH